MSSGKRQHRLKDRRRVRQTLNDVYDHGARILRGYGITNVSAIRSEETYE